MSSLGPDSVWHGRVFVASTNVLVATVIGFTKLGEIPMDARLWIVGGSIALLWATVLTWSSQTIGAQMQPKRKRARAIGCAVLVVLISVLGVRLLDLVTTYHTVRISMNTLSGTEGQIEIQASRFLTRELEMEYLVPQGKDVIRQLRTASWYPPHVPVVFGESSRSETSRVLTISNLRHPHVVGSWFRVQNQVSNLSFKVTRIEPPDMRVLSQAESRQLDIRFWLFGGTLCIAGLSLIAWRFSHS